jgi:calcineurin-like phosphoesterase
MKPHPFDFSVQKLQRLVFVDIVAETTAERKPLVFFVYSMA